MGSFFFGHAISSSTSCPCAPLSRREAVALDHKSCTTIHFSCSAKLTTCRTGDLPRLIHTLAIYVTIHTYIHNSLTKRTHTHMAEASCLCKRPGTVVPGAATVASAQDARKATVSRPRVSTNRAVSPPAQKRIFVVHGGLFPRDGVTLNHIRGIRRKRETPIHSSSFEDQVRIARRVLWMCLEKNLNASKPSNY